MTQKQNYYVIVGREGNRPVTRWSPAQIDSPTARSSDPCRRRTEPGSFAVVELGRDELIDDTAS